MLMTVIMATQKISRGELLITLMYLKETKKQKNNTLQFALHSIIF